MWICQELPGVCGIAVNEKGLIYAAGMKMSKTVYIISAEGMNRRHINGFVSLFCPSAVHAFCDSV